MNYQIRFSKYARKDLKNIYEYLRYELLIPETANRKTREIQNTIESLKFFPYQFQKVQDPEILNFVPSNIILRSFNKAGYRIFYFVQEKDNEIVITNILYGSRDMSKVFKNLDYDNL